MTMQVKCRITSDMGFELEVDGVARSQVAPTFSLSKWGSTMTGEKTSVEQSKALWQMASVINDTIDN